MTAAKQPIDLRPSREIPRRMIVQRTNGDEVRVIVYGKSQKSSRMLGYGLGAPRIARCEFTKEITLWVDRAAFDVTEAEAKELAEALDLEIQS